MAKEFEWNWKGMIKGLSGGVLEEGMNGKGLRQGENCEEKEEKMCVCVSKVRRK